MENRNYTVERRRPSKPRITLPSEKRSCELHLKKDGIKRSRVAYALSFSWFAPGNWDPTNWSSRNRWFRFLTEVQPCAFIFPSEPGRRIRGSEIKPSCRSHSLKKFAISSKERISAFLYAHPDGSPPSVPVWIGREDDRVVICTGENSLTARNTRRDPRVPLSIVDLE